MSTKKNSRSLKSMKLQRAALAALPFGCAFVAGIVASPRGASAVATWVGTVSDSWGDPANWLGTPIPPGGSGTGTTTGQTDVFVGNNSTLSLNGFSAGAGTYTVITRVRLGYAAPGQTNTGTAVLNINNGSLLTQQFNTIGDGASGILNINGGQFDIHGTDNTKDNVLAFTADSTINISSGTFVTGQYGIEQGGAFGTINLTGGQLRMGQVGSATTRAELGAEADFFNFAGGEIFQPRAMTIHQVSGVGSITSEVAAGSQITFDIAGNNTWGGVLNAGTAGVGMLAKNGPGTLTLTATQNYDRSTIVQNGTLVLDYTSSASILKNVSTISMAGGNLVFKGNSSGQQLTRLAPNAGGSTVTADLNSGGGTTLSFGSLLRTVGATVDFRASGANVLGTDVIMGTSTGNVNGILGAWATANGHTDWAFTQGGTIKAFAGYDTSGGLSDATVNYAPTASVAPIGAAVANSVKLTGSNGINLSAGSLVLTSGGILAAGTGAISGGTLTSLNGIGTASTAESDVIVVTPTGANFTISSGITDNGTGSVSFTKAGAGALTLATPTGSNTYNGSTYLTGGTLKLGANDVLPINGTLNMSTDSTIVLDLNGFNQQLNAINAGAVSASAAGIGSMTPNTGGGQVNVRSGSLTLTGNSNFGGTLAGNGSIIFTGGPSTLSSGNSTFTGTVRVTGTLAVTTLGDAAATSPIGQNSTLLIDGGTFRYAGRTNSNTDRLFTVGQNGATVEAYGFSTVNHSGAYGMIRFTNPGALLMANPGNPRTLTLTGNGGTFTLSVSVMESSIASVIPDAGAGGTVSLNKTGSVQWLLSGGNTYTGQTQISGGGTLAVTTLANGGQPSSIGASGNGQQNLSIDSSTLRYVGAGSSTDRLFHIGGGSATLDASGTGPMSFTNTGSIDGSTTLNLTGSNAGANTLAPLLSGGSSLLKNGVGAWTVTNNNNSYTGITQVNSGTVNVTSLANGGSNSAIGASTNDAANLVINGGALNYTGGAVTTDRLFTLLATGTISSSGSGPVNFNNTGNMGFGASTTGRTLNLSGTNTGANKVAAVIGDAGAGTVTNVTKSGAGTWILSGANTYTGPTRVNAGRLVLTIPAQNIVLTGPSSGGGIVNAGRLVLDYTGGTTPGATVAGILKAGNAGNFLNGQIRTENAANPNRALGWIDDTGLQQVRVAYTYRGDGDLDGDADGVDIGFWATNFTGELGGGPTATRLWSQGDWDYDGDVDGVDAGLWAQSFTGELGGNGLGSLVVNDPTISAQAASILQGMGITVVPEPATVGLLGLGVIGGLARRSRSKFGNR